MANNDRNDTNFVKDTQAEISQVWRNGVGWVNPSPSPTQQHIFSTDHHNKISM